MRLTPRLTPVAIALDDDGLAAFASRHAPGWSMDHRREPWHKLLIVLAGSGTLVARQRKLHLAEGSMLLVAAGTDHRLDDDPGSPVMVAGLCIDPVRLAAACGPAWSALERRLCTGVRMDQAMRSTALRLIGRLTRPGGSGLDAWGILLQLLASAQQARMASGTIAPTGLAETLAWVDAHAELPMSVSALAARSGMSYRAFTDQVRKTTGDSILRRIVRLRLERADTLIASGMPVIDAALAAGFGDLSGFYRHRRRRFRPADDSTHGI